MEGEFGAEHLIVQTAFLGDLLLGIPLLKELRRRFPNDKLTLFCRKGLGSLMVRLNLVDDVIEADKSSRQEWKKSVSEIRRRKFDLLICPHQSVRTALLVRSLQARRKIGYANGIFGWVFNDRVRRPMELPEALRQLALLSPLDAIWTQRLEDFARRQNLPGGQDAAGSLSEVPDWSLMSVERLLVLKSEPSGSHGLSPKSQEIRTLLELEKGRLAFIAPSSVWPTKRWTVEGFSGVARSLMASGFKVVLMGAPDERELCERVAKDAPGALSIAGKTGLFESIELLALADLLICNDSGAMHMAAAAEVPTIAIFGPTVLELGYRPWQRAARVVEVPRSELSCRPCGRHGSNACPIGTHDCMKRVSVEDVLSRALPI